MPLFKLSYEEEEIKRASRKAELQRLRIIKQVGDYIEGQLEDGGCDPDLMKSYQELINLQPLSE